MAEEEEIAAASVSNEIVAVSEFSPLAPAPVYAQPHAPQPAPAVPQPMRRAPVNYQPAEADWWLATDGLWYPPETLAPAQSPVPAPSPAISNPAAGSQNVVVNVSAPTQNPMHGAIVTGPPKSKVAAGLLGIFLGAFGAHRFYLGYSGIGVTMLLLTLLSFGLLSPFVMLWGLIEGIVILCGGMRDRWGRQLV